MSQKQEQGRAILELVKMEGWQILKQKIDSKVDQAVVDLRNMEVEGRNLSDVGSECVSLIKLIEGIKVVETEVETLLNDYYESVNQE